jgi:hypothetical protein
MTRRVPSASRAALHHARRCKRGACVGSAGEISQRHPVMAKYLREARRSSRPDRNNSADRRAREDHRPEARAVLDIHSGIAAVTVDRAAEPGRAESELAGREREQSSRFIAVEARRAIVIDMRAGDRVVRQSPKRRGWRVVGIAASPFLGAGSKRPDASSSSAPPTRGGCSAMAVAGAAPRSRATVISGSTVGFPRGIHAGVDTLHHHTEGRALDKAPTQDNPRLGPRSRRK